MIGELVGGQIESQSMTDSHIAAGSIAESEDSAKITGSKMGQFFYVGSEGNLLRKNQVLRRKKKSPLHPLGEGDTRERGRS